MRQWFMQSLENPEVLAPIPDAMFEHIRKDPRFLQEDRNQVSDAKGKRRAAKGKGKANDNEELNEERSKSIWDLVDDRVPIKRTFSGDSSELDAAFPT
jgi:hypothetical protein